MRTLCLLFLAATLPSLGLAAEPPSPQAPTRIIFDTDIGNDVDDVLALSMLHALQSRRDCELLAVTITIRDALAGPFTDAINTFYSRPDVPIGCIRPNNTNSTTKFLRLAEVHDGSALRFPHDLARSSDAPEAVHLLRRVLAREADQSVVIVQVGYFSNLGALLDSGPDDISPLSGVDLARKKVKLLSVMAGSFKVIDSNARFLEFNVIQDLPAARKVAESWPTPIVWSGFEIGISVPYPAISIQRDFDYVPHHPAAEAYMLYEPPPHERPTWDLTSVLYAVFPDRSFFDLSMPGRVAVEPDGFTKFTPSEGGRDRYLVLKDSQVPRVKEALVQLASQPPGGQSRTP